MRYPDALVKDYGTAATFAEAASAHPMAPMNEKKQTRRVLTQDSVYMWKNRDFVPYMWQPAIGDMLTEFQQRTVSQEAAE